MVTDQVRENAYTGQSRGLDLAAVSAVVNLLGLPGGRKFEIIGKVKAIFDQVRQPRAAGGDG